MVEPTQADLPHVALDRSQFQSVDSSPKSLTRSVPIDAAPQAIAVTLVVASVLTFAFNRIELLVGFFPERDLYFSRYGGGHVLPIRIFLISFFLGYASAIAASPIGRVRHAFDLLLTFLTICGVFDLGNAAMFMLTGHTVPLHAGMVISGLFGLLIFALKIMDNADMPTRVTAPFDSHIHGVPWLVAFIALNTAAGLAILVAVLDPEGIRTFRNAALLGGIGPGASLFLPLLFIILNWFASFQSILWPPRRFSPPVTVMVPAYNEAHIIGHTVEFLDAAASRYAGDVHLLIIENNSTDDTRAVAETALAQAKHLSGRVITETTRGKAFGLSRGVNETTTDYIIRVDADTQVSPDAIWRLMRHFRNPRVGVAGGMAKAPGGGPFDRARDLEIILKVGLDQVAYGAADCIFGVPGMFVCYRVDAIKAVGGFAHGMNGEDTDITVRIGESGYKVVVDPTAIYVSEVPRTFAHLREQRTRWFRSILHVCSRNRDYFGMRDFSVRSKLMIPYMMINTSRRAMTLPLLCYGCLFLLYGLDPYAHTTVQALLAFITGAPMIMVTFSALVMGRFRALLGLPEYLIFRMIRSYLTLESMLSVTYTAYDSRWGWSRANREAHF